MFQRGHETANYFDLTVKVCLRCCLANPKAYLDRLMSCDFCTVHLSTTCLERDWYWEQNKFLSQVKPEPVYAQ